MTTFGTARFEGGGTFTAFGCGKTVTIPTSIPFAEERDVTADLNAFFDDVFADLAAGPQPPPTVRIRPQPSGVYLHEKDLVFSGRRGFLLDGRNATFKQNLKAPFSAVIASPVRCTLTFLSATSSIATLQCVAPSGPFGKPSNPTQSIFGVYSWYVSGPGITSSGSQTRTKTFVSDTTITITVPADNVPANGLYWLTFISPQDRDRSGFVFEDCDDYMVKNMTIRGANTANGSFNSIYEAQHGIDAQGGDNATFKNLHVYDQWGDNISLTKSSDRLITNATVVDCEMNGAGRHGMGIKGCTDIAVMRNDIHDSNRHSIDVEPNGPEQTVRRLNVSYNRFGNAGLGTIAISTYVDVSVDVGDVVIRGNVCYGTTTNSTFSLPIGTNQTAASRRWDGFTIVNNRSAPAVAFGTGVNNPPSWAQAPGEIKFQYCDDVLVTGNTFNLQAGRLMYGVWAQTSSGVKVHDNHDHTAADTFVSPHFEKHVVAYNQGTATFEGGGTFSATGVSVPSTHGSAQFDGGGTFSATGKGKNYGSAQFVGGGTFSATGKGKNYGTASFDGGGTFSATGVGQNFGRASFDGGGDFSAAGKGVNYGTAAFDGGGDFAAVGQSATYGTATFDGGGTFAAIGFGQNLGRASFDGGGDFAAIGATDFGGEYRDGDWIGGAVKLRGPGWDDMPWDTTPWDGEE